MNAVEALTIAAPFYNLALVVVMLFLFGKLFALKNKNVFLTPWYFIFAAVVVFIIEEVITILRAARIIDITLHINGFFELLIISLFIYTLLLLREHVTSRAR
ncbi:MAG TPA: hypothetical protein VLJ21_03995 [Candidatus Binatia bacterium]|nr:hypothetical protein [Candidatus Binatia bacterium]